MRPPTTCGTHHAEHTHTTDTTAINIIVYTVPYRTVQNPDSILHYSILAKSYTCAVFELKPVTYNMSEIRTRSLKKTNTTIDSKEYDTSKYSVLLYVYVYIAKIWQACRLFLDTTRAVHFMFATAFHDAQLTLSDENCVCKHIHPRQNPSLWAAAYTAYIAVCPPLSHLAHCSCVWLKLHANSTRYKYSNFQNCANLFFEVS